MKTVAHILASKDQALYTTTTTASVFDAIKLMAEKNIGALPVVDGDKVVGIVTERDYARKMALLGRSSIQTPVHQIMTSPVLYARPDQTSEECLTLMTGIRSRHLPVMDSGKLIGLVSIGDLVKDVMSEHKLIIQQLENHLGERRSLAAN